MGLLENRRLEDTLLETSPLENDEAPEQPTLREVVFRYRGAILAIPAVALVAFGKPSAFSVTVGLPIALAGELLRCWAVGYSGVTTRGDHVEAPALVSAGPYAYVRNPLYVGNFITAVGFTVAFSGGISSSRAILMSTVSLGTMIAVYATIVPHEEAFLRSKFGAAFDEYTQRVHPVLPAAPTHAGHGTFKPEVIRDAETRTFVTFGAMLIALALKAL